MPHHREFMHQDPSRPSHPDVHHRAAQRVLNAATRAPMVGFMNVPQDMAKVLREGFRAAAIDGAALIRGEIGRIDDAITFYMRKVTIAEFMLDYPPRQQPRAEAPPSPKR